MINKEKLIEFAKTILHCGDCGSLWINEDLGSVLWIGGDADFDPDDVADGVCTGWDEVINGFKAVDGVESVDIEAESSPDEEDGWEHLGDFGIDNWTLIEARDDKLIKAINEKYKKEDPDEGEDDFVREDLMQFPVYREMMENEKLIKRLNSIEKIAMGAKPDPFNFILRQTQLVNGNTIVLAVYPGSLTFDGYKLMLLKGDYSNHDFKSLDPHFLDEEYAVVARFIPNELGWAMARKCAELL